MIHLMNTQNSQHDFKDGLKGWVAIFKAGKQTDSKGRTASYSQSDLDEMVANASVESPVPHVITHKELYSPFSYAQSPELKREGDVLYSRQEKIEPQFEKLVQDGNLFERSVRLRKTADGWRVGHVAWLGAEPPAVADLPPVEYESSADEVFDFQVDTRTPNALVRMMRNMREFFIEKFSIEDADRVMPDWDIENLSDHANNLQQAVREDISNSYSQHEHQGDPTMKEFDQADVDAAVETALKKQSDKLGSDFSAEKTTLEQQLDTERRTNKSRDYQAVVTGAIDTGHLTPAQAEGAVDFMLSLDAEQEFEFSSGDGDKTSKLKKSPVQWFQDFMATLPKQVDMSESEDDGTGAPAGDALAIADKAVEFQKSEADAGRTISVTQAVAHVTKGNK